MKNVCAIVLLEQNLQKTNITIMSEHKKIEKKQQRVADTNKKKHPNKLMITTDATVLRK